MQIRKRRPATVQATDAYIFLDHDKDGIYFSLSGEEMRLIGKAQRLNENDEPDGEIFSTLQSADSDKTESFHAHNKQGEKYRFKGQWDTSPRTKRTKITVVRSTSATQSLQKISADPLAICRDTDTESTAHDFREDRLKNKENEQYEQQLQRIQLELQNGIDPLVDICFVMHRMRRSKSQIYRWLLAGKFPAARMFGSRRMWELSKINEFIASAQVEQIS